MYAHFNPLFHAGRFDCLLPNWKETIAQPGLRGKDQSGCEMPNYGCKIKVEVAELSVTSYGANIVKVARVKTMEPFYI